MNFGDRVASGTVAAVLVILTMLVFPPAIAFVTWGAWGWGLYLVVFSKIGLLMVIGTFITGFVLGADKMATIFSFIWGTHPVWKQKLQELSWWPIAIVIVLGVLVAIYEINFNSLLQNFAK